MAERTPRSRRLGDLGMAALDALVEGAWLSVVYAGWEVGLVRHPPVLGPFDFAIAAAIGIWLARRDPPLPRAAWLAVLLALSALGWLASPVARESLLAGQPLQSLADHIGGFLLGAAVIRGGAHRVPEDDDLVLGQLLRTALPFLAIPWLIGAIMPAGPLRTQFVALAFSGTLLFVTLGFVALGLARLRELGLNLSPGERSGRAWLTVTTVIPLAVVALALPLAFWLGLDVRDLEGALIAPASLVLFLVAIILAPFLILLGAFFSILRGVAGAPPTAPPIASGGTGGLPPEATSSNQTLFLAIIVLLVLAAIVLVVAEWLRSSRLAREPRAAPLLEERAIVVPDLHLPRLPSRRRRGTGTPSDAVGAYLAALALLEPDERLARWPAETPAAHARRVAAAGADSPGTRLRRLAADYQLARYAGRPVTAREDRRALARWRWLRAHRPWTPPSRGSRPGGPAPAERP